jgi:rRNA maturation endonuclease Nob1
MILVRLCHWAFRVEAIEEYITGCSACGLQRSPYSVWIPENRCPSCGAHLVRHRRPPTLGEAITGLY